MGTEDFDFTSQRAREILAQIQIDQEKQAEKRRAGRKVGSLSDSLRRQLDNCNVLQLRTVKKFGDKLIAKHRRPPEKFECQKFASQVLASAAVKNKRYQVEMRRCGKDCRHIPHGPYLYGYIVDGFYRSTEFSETQSTAAASETPK